MSACSAITMSLVSTLLAVTGSFVLLVAVVAICNVPVAGSAKVLVQVTVFDGDAASKGLGIGLGVQACTAFAGRPLSAQLAAAASLGPAFVQVPLTVMVFPAVNAPAGKVVVPCMSDSNTTPMLS